MKKLLVLMLLVLLAQTGSTFAQDEMQMIDDIARLQSQLKSAEPSDRDAAEQQLIDMGEFVLDHLELSSEGDSVDYQNRVRRVRTTLEKIAVQRVTQPSMITLSTGNIRMTELFSKITEQTGNQVVLGRNVERAVSNSEIEITARGDQAGFTFWELIELVCRQKNLRIDPYGGAAGQLALSPNYSTAEVDDPSKNEGDILAINNGALRFEVVRVDATRSLLNPQLSHGSVVLKTFWEPRITPISISLPMKYVRITDEMENVQLPEDPKIVLPGPVSPSVRELEFEIRTALFDREVKKLKAFDGVAHAVLPGRIETFKFENVAIQTEGTSQSKAGATVTYLGIRETDDKLWGIRVLLEFDEDSKALESHQTWVASNVVKLVGKNGTQHEPVSKEVYQQSGQSVGVEYFFRQNPLDHDLVYRTPAAIVNLLIPYSFKGVPLP